MRINDTIESYRKRRSRFMPMLLGGLAVLLVVAGVIIVVTSLHGGGLAKLIATKTPTPTLTPIPTETSTLTDTPTVTATPTVTPTVTPSAPENYVVQEGDTLTSIVKAKNLGDNGLELIFLLNPSIDRVTGIITVGQTIILPNPGMLLPTSTPLPTGLAPGTRINYIVKSGDSLGSIANKYNSTVDAIVAANKTLLTKGATTVLQPGWALLIPINIVTPVPTKAATTTTPTKTPTATAKP